jgi:hypothetical protein
MPAMNSRTTKLNAADIGTAIAGQLLRNVPNPETGSEVRTDIVAILAPAFAGVLQAAVSQQRSPAKSLEQLLAPFLPLADQLGSAATSAGSTADPRSAGLAAIFAPMLEAIISNAVANAPKRPTYAPPSIPKVLLKIQSIPPVQDPQAVSGAQQTPRILEDNFATLTKTEPFKTIFGALKDSGIIDWAKKSLGGTTVPAAASILYTRDKVMDMLRSLGKTIVNVVGPEVANIAQYVEAELEQLVIRSAIAKAISEAADRLPFIVQSDRKIGQRVHQLIQNDFVASYADNALHNVVVERFNPSRGSRGLSELVVVGPLTKYDYVPLQRIAADPRKDPDMIYRALRAAMNGAKLDEEASWLRSDLVDATRCRIWEIKPVSSLAIGVWQEGLYRITFNLAHKTFEALLPPLPPRKLLSGGFLFSDSMPFGTGATKFVFLDRISVRTESGSPAIAIPFQAASLPGIVGYYVLRGPPIEDLLRMLQVAIIGSLAKALAEIIKFLNKYKKEVKWVVELAESIVQQLAITTDSLIVGIALFVLLIAVVSAAIVFGWELAAGAAAAAVLGVIILVVVGSGTGPTQGIGPLSSIDSPANGGKNPVTDLMIGPIQISGVPQEQVAKFLSEVQIQFYNLAGVIVKTNPMA